MKRFFGGVASKARNPRPSGISDLFVPSPHGWKFRGNAPQASPVAAYLRQLEEEGRALDLDGQLVIPWEDVFDLLADGTHASSLPLLGLPPIASERMALSSQGSPADREFRILLAGWIEPDGRTSRFPRVGPVLEPDHRPRLIPHPAFGLLREIDLLEQEGAAMGPHWRMLAMGRIQTLAGQCGAELDLYLSSTPVIVPESWGLQLSEDSVAGVRVIEVRPQPEGAPEQWIQHFDRYQTAQARYDVPLPEGGLVHVVLPDPAREFAGAIKALPARRLGGNHAATFLQNPYVFLGEGADKIISPEEFDRAKAEAGLIEWELDLQPEDDGWAAVLVDSSGTRDDEFLGVFDAAATLEIRTLAHAARKEGLGAMRWAGRDVALCGMTLASLDRLAQASVDIARSASADGQWLDLSRYSDRVVGFDGQPIHVPRIAQTDAGRDWTSGEYPPLTVDRVEPATGAMRSVVLGPDGVKALVRGVESAESCGQEHVEMPGGGFEVPTAEARSWVDSLKEVARKGPAKLETPREPCPSAKLALRILHNIEQLDYGHTDSPAVEQMRPPEIPKALKPEVDLKTHQVDGVAWLQARFRQMPEGVRGVLLADDMGLGKTLQCLCLMAWYRETAEKPLPCLVVAPVSLLENWTREIDKFLDGSQGPTITLYGEHLAKYRLAGSQVPVELQARGMRKALREGFARGAAFVLTTYETLRDFQLSLAREHWGIVVCDEAQKIKTPGAMVTRAAKALHADFKVACTGTPVENTLADLWCLFDFFQPGLLDSLNRFTRVFRQDIELRGDRHEELLESLRAKTTPWVLRRMKHDVAELPPKTPVTCELPMSGRQLALYGTAVSEFREAMKEAGQDRNNTILGLLHRLRMICANPLAMDRDDAEFVSVQEHLAHSPKLAWLLDQLVEIQKRGEKAIVFSEYREIQRLIQQAVASRFGILPAVVNGSTSVDPRAEASRQAIIDGFQAAPGFGVIVLSTTAVGFGVNIQGANHVIHFTRPWNPAKEDQATDRAYRIGQQREVYVYCPTVVGQGFESFEERVAERLAAKRALSNDMLAPEQGIGIEEFAGL